MATQLLTADRTVSASRKFLEVLAEGYRPRDFAVRFWDGSEWGPEPGQPANFTFVLNHPAAVRKMFWPPNGVAFAEAYVFDDFDIAGDIFAFMRFAQHMNANQPHGWKRVRQGLRLLGLPKSGGRPRVDHPPIRLRGRKHSLERDRDVIGYHYDLSNDFFGLWLDQELLYTCAYFTDVDQDLETAQRQKIDYVCRKLRLKPGERMLDIGCGWGALVMHAARHYGVEAVGITLSRKQVEKANERIAAAGLQDRCRVEYRDYREMTDAKGFDKIACVGMLEHLGEMMIPVFFRCAYALLKPGGVLMNHGLTLKANTPYPKWTKFARQYVFPDGELRPVTSSLLGAEAAGFEIRDVESLRDHYAITLRHWVRRLEARRDEVVAATSEATYRVFRLYLAGAMVGMRNGVYNLHQSVLAKPVNGETGLPLTREDWYRPGLGEL